MRISRRVGGADKTHRDPVGFARNIERYFVALQPNRAAALALHQPAVQLAGNLPLALAQHMIDGRRNRRQPAGDLAFRRTNRKPSGKFLRYEAGGEIALAPARMMHQRRQERNVVTNAIDVERIERGRLRLYCRGARRRVGHELGDHRIVIDRDLAAFLHAGVVANGDAGNAALDWRTVFYQPPDRGQEVAERIFRIDAGLHRPSRQRDVLLRQRQLFARGHPDHLFDQIDPGDQFGHGVLDLQPGVHLQEVEALVLTGDEFDGSGVIVIHGLGECDRLFAHLPAGGLVEQWRRRFLDHLLIAPLDRTFALAEIDHVAVLVPQHLNFDVAGIDDEFLDENTVVTERRFGFGLGETEPFGDFGSRMRDPHPLAAAAGGGLDHDGIADLVGNLHRMLFVLDDAEMARHRRDLGFRGGLLGFDLVAHRGDRAGVGSDEHDAGLAHRARKGFAFRQEAIAGMHSLGARLAAGLDDLFHREGAFGRGRRSDQNRVIGHFDVECIAVRLRIDREPHYSHAPGSLDNPAGDLAAICDQDSFEHVFLLATFGRDPHPAIWHAGTEVTNPKLHPASLEITTLFARG